jgi:hypothetical protein
MKKVGQDLGIRMRQWGSYLDEYKKEPLTMISSYPHQISQRVILQALLDEQDPGNLLVAPLQFMLQTLDAALKVIFTPGDFIWEPALMAGFPKDMNWYLYGTIKSK